MEADFWHHRWETNRIGFHEGRVNTLLARHGEELPITPEATIFVPLCGRAVDMLWLREQGPKVVGAELSERAVREFFEMAEMTPDITKLGSLTAYEAEGIRLFAGDIFDLTPNILGSVDATYDRAALVALPEPMRSRYATHMVDLTQSATALDLL